MSFIAIEPRRRGILSSLFGSAVIEAEGGAVGSAHDALWNEIGCFLATHRLEPTPTNFAVVHAHVSGDPAVRLPVEAALRESGTVDARLIAELDEARSGGIKPEFLTEMAGKLECRLADCFRLVGLSASSVADYSAALDQGVEAATGDPQAAFARLVRLTGAMSVATRAIEGQFDDARRETERLRADLQAARRAAERDHLTGLPNRRHFDLRLAAVAAAEHAAPPVLALCDIDDFKRVNDLHGHETGDRVLQFFGSAIRRRLRGRALVARYGGEEFACLFEGTTLAEVRVAIDGLRETMMDRTLHSRTSGAEIGAISFSTGLTIVGEDVEEALRRADRALYAAKRNGKNRIEVEVVD